MNDITTYPLRLPPLPCPASELTSSGRPLGDAIDSWLADAFSEDWHHVHDWSDEQDDRDAINQDDTLLLGAEEFTVRDSNGREVVA